MNITYEDMDILYVYINVNCVCSIDHYILVASMLATLLHVLMGVSEA